MTERTDEAIGVALIVGFPALVIFGPHEFWFVIAVLVAVSVAVLAWAHWGVR